MTVARKICSIVARVLGALILLCAAIVGIALYENAPPLRAFHDTETVSAVEDTGEVQMELREGESAASVGFRLKEAALIKQYYAWQLLCHLRPEYLKAGMYQFRRGLSLIELHQLFTTGSPLLASVTIPEGSTIRKTAELLEEAGICTAADFTAASRSKKLLAAYSIPADNFEGYLYPDTYHFNLRYPAEMVVRMMADTFFKRIAALTGDTIPDPQTLFNTVILASVIEREYRIAEEAPVIAGVFQNRLQAGMRLESCATIVYALTENQGKPHPQRLFYRDLELDDPYNTYLHRGLPPAPIASPGAVALQAAFNPQTTGYLFFRIVDPAAGRHYFSESFDEHIKAGALLVK